MSSTARWAVVTVAVFAVACTVRIGVVLASRGGPAGNFGYDPSVYYTAADALTFGRLPYRDFVLLHPPGLMLVAVPFALLGRLTSDHTGFIAANTAFEVLGAVNAALVVAVGRRAQLSLPAAALGGLFYATWDGAAQAEVSLRLEPLGAAAFLCGLLALMSPRSPRSRAALAAAGAAFGFAVSVKVWWSIPLLVVLAWHLRPGRRREAALLAAGALAAGLLIDGPFLLSAPRAMWRMVVVDQLGRHRIMSSPLTRLDRITSVYGTLPAASSALQAVALVAVTVLAGMLVVAAWRVASCRLIVAVAAAQLVVLLASPSYFSFYADYLTATAALIVAAAAHSAEAARDAGPTRTGRLGRLGRLGRVAAVATVALAVASTATVLLIRPDTAVTPFPSAQLARAADRSRCVMADSPMALIELDALSRDFARRCPNWVDVSGRTYDADASLGGQDVTRPANAKWQRDLENYLLSGDAVITIRTATGYSPAARRLLGRLPVLARVGHLVLHRVPRPSSG